MVFILLVEKKYERGAPQYVKAPTEKSKKELDALLFGRAARRNRTDPYEEKKYRGPGIKEGTI